MKKLLYIIVLGLLWSLWFTRANVNSINIAPATQSAISGSLVTFTVTWANGTGDAYVKYILPKTAVYDIAYQNSNLTPLNNALISLGAEHDPVFYIPAHSNFSVTITAKIITTVRTISTTNTTANAWSDMQVTNILTSAIAQITPIADLKITNILTGNNPSTSGDTVSYHITLQNIWSTAATGISFISNFPIPTLAAPSATFNGTPHLYNYINYPQDFVWTGSYLSNLNPGQTMTIMVNAPMTQNFAVGTTFNQIAKTTTASAEYTTGNNSVTATGIVQANPDIWVKKTLAPFTGYRTGDQMIYTITYGNSWGKAAIGVVITDIAPVWIILPATTFNIWTLPAWSGWTIILTGTLTNLLTSWSTLVNTANITTTSTEWITWNNSSTTTGVVQGIANVTLSIIANNLTKPQLDNVPYGSWPSILIQAMSGDIVQLTITYANFGNVLWTNATIAISWTQGFTTLGTYNGTIGTLILNTTWTLIVTGIVGPKNYISFAPTARLTYNSGVVLTDNVTVQEPLVCGDGAITRTEPCDTQGNLGVLFSGQVCENQQGVCVLVTQNIINNACINYQYNNPLGGITTGQTCSYVQAAITNASCNTMTRSDPVITNNGYTINFACTANNATATTPITIDCGNGTSISWSWLSLSGTCSYASSFNGNAQCRVWNDTNNISCRKDVSAASHACDLEALDGRVVIIDNNKWEAQFRCDTHDHTLATQITIDCGIDGTADDTNSRTVSDTNISSLTTTCHYTHINNTPVHRQVQCYINTDTTPCEDEDITLDKWTFWRCGDGVRDGREQCDGTDGLSEWEICTDGCYIAKKSPVGCFNISNANLSVQENEYLPFWRKVDAVTKSATICNSGTINKINKDSLLCTFEIYKYDYDEAPLDTITRKCKSPSDDAIFNYFSQYNSDAYGKFTKLINDDITHGIYGEYKIRLTEVNYEYCDGNDFVSWAPLKRVCETNFTVTKPYIVQKSSFGLTPKATNTADLDQFYTLNQTKITTSTDMNKIMILDADEYKWGNTIVTMMDNFITKYSKIAVKYKTIKSEENTDITVSKVPGKDIIVFKGNGTLSYTDGDKKTDPFTIIVDGPSIKINWSIENTNAMFLVNKWNITFLPSADVCTKTQVVKWIFVTKNNFLASGNIINNDPDKDRCAFGGLKVQGILIGNGIENIVNSRRSQLNHRFTVAGRSDDAIKSERRNEIFNGAALLIEYSPNLWSALPPGASEFTKALDVYKQ